MKRTRKPKSRKPLLSLVLPIYNEEETLPLLILELHKLKKLLGSAYRCEFVFVDDGSQDTTPTLLRECSRLLPLTVLTLSRNFGHQAALLAGLQHAQGEVVVTLDSDLQHPPSFIPKLLAAYERGYDIVLTKRRDDATLPLSKKATSWLFYKVLNLSSQTHVQEAGSDFRLLSRSALDALLELPEKRVFLRGMVSWIGFRTQVLEFSSHPRRNGVSKYNLYKMTTLALFGLASFSTMPLYLSVLVGLLFSLATGLYGVYVLYIRFVLNQAVAGWSSVIFVLLAIGGILSFLLAIIGLYLAAIYDETKRRPIYIMKTPRKSGSP